MRYTRRIRARRTFKRLNRRRARKIRTFKLEKRKLGLAGQLIYAGLPERKKMFLSSPVRQLKFYDGKEINSINLSPKYATDWATLFYNKVPNWDKIAISRIYIKIMPTFNNYGVGQNHVVPQFIGYYVIGAPSTQSTDYDTVKQLINFDGSKPFTVLLEKPSVVTRYGAAIYRSGTYLSLARIGLPTDDEQAGGDDDEQDGGQDGGNDDNNNDDDNQPAHNRRYRRNPPPPVVDEDSEEDVEDWGDEQDTTINNYYGNFVIGLDSPVAPAQANAIKLRYKIFYKAHLRG